MSTTANTRADRAASACAAGGKGRGSGSAARPDRMSSSSRATSGRQAAISRRARVEPVAMSSSVSARSSSGSGGTGGGGCAGRQAQLTRCPSSPGGPNVRMVGISATSAPTHSTASPASTASTVSCRGPASPCGSPGLGSATRMARAPCTRNEPRAVPSEPTSWPSGPSVTVCGSSSPCTRATTSSRVTCPVSQLPAQAASRAERGSPSMSVSLRVTPAVGSSATQRSNEEPEQGTSEGPSATTESTRTESGSCPTSSSWLMSRWCGPGSTC